MTHFVLSKVNGQNIAADNVFKRLCKNYGLPYRTLANTKGWPKIWGHFQVDRFRVLKTKDS